jgi:hypothetical protein
VDLFAGVTEEVREAAEPTPDRPAGTGGRFGSAPERGRMRAWEKASLAAERAWKVA